jgi:hypothetical protein
MAQVSLVSFVRNQLGFPGKSVNSGRGFFMCEIYEEITWTEFSDRVKTAIAVWQERGLLKTVDVDKNEIKIEMHLEGGNFQFSKRGIDRNSWYSIPAGVDIEV